MSRRASLFKKKNPGKPRVRFPDELVFQDSVKENDIEHMNHMLRRASLQMDLNAINTAGESYSYLDAKRHKKSLLDFSSPTGWWI